VSNRTTAQKNARELQRLAEDVLRGHVRDPAQSREEHLATVFLAHRELLKASAERRAQR
jgi:hypothetical protein